MKVGERIREIRRAAGLRQKVLARAIGVSPGALTNFEKGRRRVSLEWLVRIAEALDTSVASLLSQQNAEGMGDPRERRLLVAWRDLPSSEPLRADYMRLFEHLGQLPSKRRRKTR